MHGGLSGPTILHLKDLPGNTKLLQPMENLPSPRRLPFHSDELPQAQAQRFSGPEAEPLATVRGNNLFSNCSQAQSCPCLSLVDLHSSPSPGRWFLRAQARPAEHCR